MRSDSNPPDIPVLQEFILHCQRQESGTKFRIIFIPDAHSFSLDEELP
jgi:hypothetical protein